MNSHRCLDFRPYWQDRAQDTKKVTKMRPKARQGGSKFTDLGTSWRQVGQHRCLLDYVSGARPQGIVKGGLFLTMLRELACPCIVH